jgi:hypothetical protein
LAVAASHSSQFFPAFITELPDQFLTLYCSLLVADVVRPSVTTDLLQSAADVCWFITTDRARAAGRHTCGSEGALKRGNTVRVRISTRRALPRSYDLLLLFLLLSYFRTGWQALLSLQGRWVQHCCFAFFSLFIVLEHPMDEGSLARSTQWINGDIHHLWLPTIVSGDIHHLWLPTIVSIMTNDPSNISLLLRFFPTASTSKI